VGGLARNHVGWRRVARGWRAARETAGSGGVIDASRNRAGEGLEVEDKGRFVIFQKYKDSTIKLR
jgi:hypothetical protein